MQELTAAVDAALGLGFLYWLPALAAIGAAIYFPKSGKHRAIAAAFVVVLSLVLPAKVGYEAYAHSRYAQEAWAHFRKLCAEKSGEKIYKTFSGVKSVVVLKPLPPASDKDHFDQFWFGDPYSAFAHSERGAHEAGNLVGLVKLEKGVSNPEMGFEYVDLKRESDGTVTYQRIARPLGSTQRIVTSVQNSEAQFGIIWDDISSPRDRDFWVAGSRLQIIDLRDKSVVAERTGFLIEAGFGSRAASRRPWLSSRNPHTSCPPIRNGTFEDRWFVLRVLRPT